MQRWPSRWPCARSDLTVEVAVRLLRLDRQVGCKPQHAPGTAAACAKQQ
jgi:hypothetical protein